MLWRYNVTNWFAEKIGRFVLRFEGVAVMLRMVRFVIGFLIISTIILEANYIEHKVAQGESLYTIAKKYDLSIQAICRANNIDAQDTLKADSVIKIPHRVAATYTVQAGDTLSTVAERHGISTAQLAKANKKNIEDIIRVGEKLTIPPKPNSAKDEHNTIYKIKPGDTLWSIAKRFGTTPQKLAQLNNIKESEALKVGKKLHIQSSIRTPNTPTTTQKPRQKKKKKRAFITIVKSLKKSKRPAKLLLTRSKKRNGFERFNLNLADKVTKLAKQKLGRRYVWGATGSNAFDCSGLTTYVYKKVGVNLPRTSRNQARFGKYVPKHKLRKGDLVFFDTDLRRRGIDHVGIYLGNGKFIHASSAKKKVIITSLNKPFYAKRFRGGRRVLKSSI